MFKSCSNHNFAAIAFIINKYYTYYMLDQNIPDSYNIIMLRIQITVLAIYTSQNNIYSKAFDFENSEMFYPTPKTHIQCFQ